MCEALESRQLMAATLTTLVSFGGADGRQPLTAPVADSAGILYGTTSGGSTTPASIFRFNPVTNEYAPIGSLSGYGIYGRLAIDANGILYGTASSSENTNDGIIFRLDTATSGSLTTVHAFAGYRPYGGLVSDGNGNLYGTTITGGGNGNGLVYKFNTATSTFMPLVPMGTANVNPFTELTLGSDGNFYGVSSYGGTSDLGTLFRYNTLTDTLDTLIEFDNTTGGRPRSPLLADGNGNFYGTTTQNAAGNFGSVFSFNPLTSTLTTLATAVDGSTVNPTSPLIANAAGNLYGASGLTVFKLDTTNNSLSEVAAFGTIDTTDGDADGNNAIGGLIADARGNLYGTTVAGGQLGDGTLYKLAGSDYRPLDSFAATLPAQAIAGQKTSVKLSVPLANPSGTAAFKQRVRVELFTSTDAALSEIDRDSQIDTNDDLAILTVNRKIKIKPGGTTAIKLAFKKLPANLPTANHRIIARLTPETGEPTLLVTDSAIAVDAAVVNLSGTVIAPTTLTPGKKEKLFVDITSQGNVPVSQKVLLGLAIAPGGDLEAASVLRVANTRLSLKPGQTRRFTFTFTTPTLAAGSYKLLAQIDANDAIAETDEADNLIFSAIDSVIA